MRKVDISKIKLEYRDVVAGGRQIHALIGQEVPCVEFTMRGDVYQPITWSPKEPMFICSDPFIQFQPQEWKDMIDEIFTEMVKLWNEKHGGANEKTSGN